MKLLASPRAAWLPWVKRNARGVLAVVHILMGLAVLWRVENPLLIAVLDVIADLVHLLI